MEQKVIDGFFEHPKHMFKLMVMKISTMFGIQSSLISTYGQLFYVLKISKGHTSLLVHL